MAPVLGATPESSSYGSAAFPPVSPLVGGPTAVRYKESPLSSAASGGLLAGGKAGSGSPAEQRWDAAEWARTLQRLGIDAYKLGQYVDNLRGALYSEISSLLDRLGEVVDELEARYGVPRELMLDLRCVGGLGCGGLGSAWFLD